MHNVTRINNFIETLSTERFDRYRVMADGDTAFALELYACNARISQALYIPLQALEVTLRNSVHICLQASVGDYWFDVPEVLKSPRQIEAVAEVKVRLMSDKKSMTTGGIIAGLPFGFWTGMFGDFYEDLWRSDLHRIVVNKDNPIKRKDFSGPLRIIRQIRNRIAHHECIINWDVQNHYYKMKHLVELMSSEAKFWMENNSIFDNVYDEQKALLTRLHKGAEGNDSRAETN